jgi:hypothetical protein
MPSLRFLNGGLFAKKPGQRADQDPRRFFSISTVLYFASGYSVAYQTPFFISAEPLSQGPHCLGAPAFKHSLFGVGRLDPDGWPVWL